jgi:hypothetical protein
VKKNRLLDEFGILVFYLLQLDENRLTYSLNLPITMKRSIRYLSLASIFLAAVAAQGAVARTVPDSGSTLALLGIAGIVLGSLRRFLK